MLCVEIRPQQVLHLSAYKISEAASMSAAVVFGCADAAMLSAVAFIDTRTWWRSRKHSNALQCRVHPLGGTGCHSIVVCDGHRKLLPV